MRTELSRHNNLTAFTAGNLSQGYGENAEPFTEEHKGNKDSVLAKLEKSSLPSFLFVTNGPHLSDDRECSSSVSVLERASVWAWPARLAWPLEKDSGLIYEAGL
jgi:hypothetical protein